MDIVYIVGKCSKHNDIELRMSLRSICKYGKGVGKVIIAGSPPDWLSKEAVQVCVQDRYSYKHNNILMCLENVIAKGLVSGRFLYSSDDHFYLKPVDFSIYPVFRKNIELRDSVDKDDINYKYHKSLVDTRELLLSRHLPISNYSQHCNTYFNAEVFRSFIDIVHLSYELPYGTEPTSLLMNCWQTIENAPVPIERRDAKLNRPYDSASEILCKLNKRHCFSIGDGIFSGKGIYELFKTEFPDKCIFEM